MTLGLTRGSIPLGSLAHLSIAAFSAVVLFSLDTNAHIPLLESLLYWEVDGEVEEEARTAEVSV